MKKIFLILLVILLMSLVNSRYYCYATDEMEEQDSRQVNLDSVLESQQNSLNISSFLKEAKKYTDSVYKDIDMNELFTSALTGKVDNEMVFGSIAHILGKEVISSITVLGSIVVIIIIHSILKSVSEGLENKAISQITYYVQYILIVTLIMTNFTRNYCYGKRFYSKFSRIYGLFNSNFDYSYYDYRKYCLCYNASTNYFIYNYLYWKLY